MSDNDGYAKFTAALSDPAAAVARLLTPNSSTVSVMVDVMLANPGNHAEIANALVAAIDTDPRRAAYAVTSLARRKFDFSSTNAVAALRPHVQAHSAVAVALLQLGVAEPVVIERLEATLEDFDELSNTMSALRWSVEAGVDPKPLAHIALAALARDPESGVTVRAIRAFAEAGADMSGAVPELERRAGGDEDDEDYDDEAAEALEAIRGSRVNP